MHQYFIKKKIDNFFIIEENDLHHLKNVVKLTVGKEIKCVFNNQMYLCEVVEINETIAKIGIKKEIKTNNTYSKKILIMGIIREQRWDYVLQKATELGVDVIVPVEFKRNVVKIDSSKATNKVKRWQEICSTAAKQSKRLNIPTVENIVTNLNDLQKYVSDINLVAWEEEKTTVLKTTISNKEFDSISFVIGCEGGIDENEIEKLKELNFLPISLGTNILRAETAPLFVLSSLIYENK